MIRAMESVSLREYCGSMPYLVMHIKPQPIRRQLAPKDDDTVPTIKAKQRVQKCNNCS